MGQESTQCSVYLRMLHVATGEQQVFYTHFAQNTKVGTLRNLTPSWLTDHFSS